MPFWLAMTLTRVVSLFLMPRMPLLNPTELQPSPALNAAERGELSPSVWIVVR
jgi:hypothetical protein